MFDEDVYIVLINSYISDVILKTYSNYYYENPLAVSGQGAKKNKTNKTKTQTYCLYSENALSDLKP